MDADDRGVRQAATGDSGKHAWHAGFLKHAQTVHASVSGMPEPPKLIIGHSLGAASAQIVGASLWGRRSVSPRR